MTQPPEHEESEAYADEVENAVQAFWRGDSVPIERLLAAENAGGPRVGELLGPAVGARGAAGAGGSGAADSEAVARDGANAGSECHPPTQIGDYRIIRELGRGGMGVVYEAEQQQPQRAVALKVIRGGAYVDEHHLRLFQRETQALARLKHPNIAAIYAAGRTEDGQHFFAMELVRGQPLLDFVPPGAYR